MAKIIADLTFSDLPLEVYVDSMTAAGVPDAEVTAAMYALSQSCRALHSLFQDELADRAYRQFWQAVIDGKLETIIKFSNKKPHLFYQLMTQAIPNSFIIQSKLTFRIFELEGETFLSAAVKLKQLKVIQTLLLCCKQLKLAEEYQNKLQEEIAYALSQWKYYDLITNAQGEEEIDIPQAYKDLAQSSIEVFITETFPNGIPGENGIPLNIELSKITETALSKLLDELVPKNAKKIDEHFDTELFLLALLAAYRQKFPNFNWNWNQLDAACRRAIGLTLPTLIRETGEIWCESLIEVVGAIENGKEKEISTRAKALKLKDGSSFYRDLRDCRSGAGFDFFCDIGGSHTRRRGDRGTAAGGGWCFGKIMSSKDNKFSEDYAAITAATKPSPRR